MDILKLSFLLLLAVLASSYLVRALPLSLPTPIVQIALGCLIAAFTNYGITLEPDIFFLLFLPPLLFLDGWRVPNDGLLRDKYTILQLALGLVVFTVLGIGLLIHWVIPGMPLPVAFALAAILSPTDPVAVSSITSRTPMPKRLMRILEGESLLNDASGLVCFRFAIAAALTGTFSFTEASKTLLWVALAGLSIGAAVMFAAAWAQRVFARRFGEDRGAPVLLSLLVPFAAYLLAEHFNASGILAAVAAGITMSYVELSGKAQANTRIQRTAAWDTLQFALNGAIFVLLGEQLPSIFRDAVIAMDETGHHSPAWLLLYVLILYAGLVLLRFAWVWVSLWVTLLRSNAKNAHNAQNTPISLPGKMRWKLVAAASLSGVRGSLTLAGVLTIPLALPDGSPFPARELAIFLAAAVILASLITASLLLPTLLKGLEIPAAEAGEQEEDLARSEAAHAAITALRTRISQTDINHTPEHPDPTETDPYITTAARLLELYEQRLQRAHSADPLNSQHICQNDQAEHELTLIALRAEREAIFRLARSFRISDTTARKLVRELDFLESRHS